MQVALNTIKEHVGSLKEVHFVLFSNDTWTAYLNYAKSAFEQEQCEVADSTSSPVQGEYSEEAMDSSAMDESQSSPAGEVRDQKGEGGAQEIQDSEMGSTPDPATQNGSEESPPLSPKTNNKGSPGNKEGEL